MLGISYGGISQLFAAQLQPHALEAIAPLSVVDATATTLYPGGILNTGFAVPWAEERQHDAEPAGPGNGEHWAYEQIQKGDLTCAANQDLHGEATNLLTEIKENSTYNPPVADPLDPVTFVHNINVPTFMACQWQDEQTGGHCADLAEHFTGTEAQVVHVHQRRPCRLARSVHVQPALRLPGAVRRAQGADPQPGGRACRGSDHLSVGAGAPRGRQRHAPAGPDPGNADIRSGAARPSRRSRRSGCCSTTAQEPRRPAARRPATRIPRFEQSFSAFPIPGTTARSWYLGPEGDTRRTARNGPGGRLLHLRCERHAADGLLGGNTGPGGLWGAASAWEWNWAQPPAGSAVSYVSAPLSQRHDGDRRRRRQPVGEVIHSGRRSPGDRQRGAPRRQRNVRPERLDPRQRAQARHHLDEHVRRRPPRRWSRSRPSLPPTCSRCRLANSFP